MTKAKGDRREREARDIYEAAGYTVQPFYGRPYGETDGFGLFDLVATKPRSPPRFVQVKSNQARGIREWTEETQQILPDWHAIADMAVCHDNAGWRLITVRDNGYRTVVDERDEDVDMGEHLQLYLTDE